MKKNKISKRIQLSMVLIIVIPNLCISQKTNWQNLDFKEDKVFGISAELAYTKLLKAKKVKKTKPVLIAIIDSGVDTLHEDLRIVLWNNPKEIPNNKIDDDKNGYADDLHGWNFIGGADSNVCYDNLELTRQVKQKSLRFEGKDSSEISKDEIIYFNEWLFQKKLLQKKTAETESAIFNIRAFKKDLDSLVIKIGKQKPSLSDFKNYQPKSPIEERVKTLTVNNLLDDSNFVHFKETQIDGQIQHLQEELDYHLNIGYDPRSIVGDDYANSKENYYGNNNITGPDALHGTHVTGIIGAIRDNNRGIKGVASHVSIMAIRVVPKGDERDKDVANAIRYAVDNGAKIINLSFGKGFTNEKKVVDEAVQYAMSKDVLIVHAAGNDNLDLDKEPNYPNKIYADGTGEAEAWIEVGASGWKDDENLKAPFSNYGQTTVDVFAPGVNIYSTAPGSKYILSSGTSMAAPVVTGLAVLIRFHYPKLSAKQVKEIIMKSVVKIDNTVLVKDKPGKRLYLFFNEICVSGGIVNAYNALKLAAKYK